MKFGDVSGCLKRRLQLEQMQIELREKLCDKTQSSGASQSTEGAEPEKASNGADESGAESVCDSSVGDNGLDILSDGGCDTREDTPDNVSEEHIDDSLSEVGTLLDWAEGKVTEMPGRVSEFRRTSGKSVSKSAVQNWLERESLSIHTSEKRPRSLMSADGTGPLNPSGSCHTHVLEGKRPKLE